MAADAVRMSGARWRPFLWGGAAALLALPAVAGAPWTGSDFVAAGLMLAMLCGGLELAMRSRSGFAYRAGAAAAVMVAFFTLWSNLAVGMIGSEDNPYNLAFFGVLLLALAGGFVARFRAAGMAWAMGAAAAAQVTAAALGVSLYGDLRGGMISAAFGLVWLFSAALFRKAAEDEAPR